MSALRFGSRGQQRLAVLWLKMAELGYIAQSSGESPVLLLDDIFSELDENSQKIVLSILPDQQTFLTTVEEADAHLAKWQIVRL
jgi:DNA replication and repair protein RecF